MYPGPLNFTALSAVVGMVCATISACISELANTECVLLNCECSSGFTGGGGEGGEGGGRTREHII